MSRPSKYKATFNKQAEKLSKLGATDKEMADFFEVAESTINLWKIEHPKFSESIKKGKLEADANVAEALYKRAIGFEYNETTFEKIDSKEVLMMTSEGEIVKGDQYKKKVVRKLIPGDVAAINIWLKNRRSKVNPDDGQRWADKQELGLTDSKGFDITWNETKTYDSQQKADPGA